MRKSLSLGLSIVALTFYAQPDLASDLPAYQCSGFGLCGPGWVEARAPTQAGFPYTSSEEETYYYEVQGPANAIVSATISYFLYGDVSTGFDQNNNPTGQANGNASITVTTASDTFNDSVSALVFPGSGPSPFQTTVKGGDLDGSWVPVSKQLLVQANTLYTVTLAAYGNVDSLAPGIKATGFADPVITIDPSMYPDYSVALSPGMTNTLSLDRVPAPVPLPAAGWLLLSALGGLGSMARKSLIREPGKPSAWSSAP
ncbi:MAG TPA: VPLPA-CTERM sorting domain-containing protein [Steroidobacteraceae bacterium]